MKRFQYTLDSILRYHEGTKEMLLLQLQKVREEIQALQEQIHSIQQELYHPVVLESKKVESINIYLVQRDRYHTHLRRKLEQLRKKIQQLTAIESETLHKIEQENREIAKLEKLQEKQWNEWCYQAQQEQQRLLDESACSRYFRSS